VQVLTWLAAVVVATSLGLLAVGIVGDAVRGRGPLGDTVVAGDQPTAAPSASPADPAQLVRRDLTQDYGTFSVACDGPYARGEGAEPGADGWRVVRFEPGPDDDVEAVFASATELVEIEVFCNRGRPALAEVDRSRITESD
jgi:hypothetical protein